MSLKLNLEKATKSLRLNLEKAGIMTPPELEVGFGMDVSQSFEDEHRDGVTDKLLTRLVPWGLTFDPDKKLDCFTFSDGANNVHDVGPVDESNYFGFVQRKIINCPGFNGGTTYADVIEAFLRHFGWMGDIVKKAGLIGKFFGKKDEIIAASKKRSLVIITTDGDNQDHQRTIKVLRASQERGDQVYFLFLGVSNQGSRFPFLESIGDMFDNTGFVSIPNLHKFVALSDDELNSLLLGEELLVWLKK